MSARYKGLSAKQDEALANIALGGDGRGVHRATLAVLEKRGFIVGHDWEIARDRFGPVIVKAYEMPIAEHMEWCRWCAEHYPEPENRA